METLRQQLNYEIKWKRVIKLDKRCHFSSSRSTQQRSSQSNVCTQLHTITETAAYH